MTGTRRFAPKLARQLTTATLAALLCGAAHAQGLVELYEAARAYDATYLAARAQADAAEYRAAQADALALPTLSANLKGVGTQVDLPGGRSGDNNALQGGLNGRMPLFNRANQATIEQAQRALIASKAELESAEQDLIIRLAQAYFDVLSAKDDVALAEANKAYILEQLASAKRNFEVGTATITDTREAQARFDLDTATEIAAENDLRTKRIALDQLVGRANVAPKPLQLPAALPEVRPAAAEEWVTVADQSHPTVRKARVAILAFGSMVKPATDAGEDLNATVANMRFVKPIDADLIRRLAETHDYLVTVEENAIMGGAGSAVRSWKLTNRGTSSTRSYIWRRSARQGTAEISSSNRASASWGAGAVFGAQRTRRRSMLRDSPGARVSSWRTPALVPVWPGSTAPRSPSTW